jgi:glycosyltransferase involved in cell wall biosynthesis
MNETHTRVDLHLHSYASNVTSYYVSNAFAIPESYSEPRELYRMLKARGMSLVTITDHNSIDGVRELLDAGLRDVFISAEMTTTFPEDGCKIHVTIANVTEAQFQEAHRLRTNIFEMIAYLEGEIARERPDGNKLVYFMTHPLISTENRPHGREGSLSIAHLEKAMLLIPCFEVLNGSRDKALHDLTAGLVASLDRPLIERLADQYNLEPRGKTPWLKGFVGGSDDHSGINPGRTWTRFATPVGRRATANDLVEAIRLRQAEPGGAYGGPITLANGVLKLLYDGSKQKNREKAGRNVTVSIKGPVHSLLELVFQSKQRSTTDKLVFELKRRAHLLSQKWRIPAGAGVPSFEQMLERAVYELLSDTEFRRELAATTALDERIYKVVGTLINRLFARYAEGLMKGGAMNLVGAIKQVVALAASSVFVSLPYLMSFSRYTSDSLLTRDVRKHFPVETRERVVLITDTFFDINGVSATIRRMISEAIRRDIDFTVIACVSAEEREQRLNQPGIRDLVESGRLKLFTSIVSMKFPEYEGMQVHIPPFLDLLRFLQEGAFTKMQISTPGIMGLAGLGAAKTLQMETASTYHTAIPEYVEQYTKDITLEAFAWRYMILFYHLVDEVLVPSKYVARLLHKRGLRNRKLITLDRWVDPERFHPEKRRADYFRKFGLEGGDKLVKFVYVGRLGVEKDLALVATAYRRLRATRPDAHLIFIGDGPYRRELERQLAGLPVTFTGFLEGAELPVAIASADAKLFPSATDTWGNAPLEAEASGLPVVVSDIGGPAELMQPGVTGFRIPAHDANALHDAMVQLMDAETRRRLGENARRFVERERVDEPFTAVFDSAGYRARVRNLKRDAAEGDVPMSMQIIDLTIAPAELDKALEATS